MMRPASAASGASSVVRRQSMIVVACVVGKYCVFALAVE
jgi:hypothetical protein